ncbi:hypothetical protein chiPu_0021715 [Chiloscyllium punctatum]|uniref:Uncharacterized protein n=1 Tax=Chiloscyllium punctatum TaxID=137246 RepID=A0A401RL03_CHIPU|nr:hypothetical protein [Chiloscyllium punctatum]
MGREFAGLAFGGTSTDLSVKSRKPNEIPRTGCAWGCVNGRMQERDELLCPTLSSWRKFDWNRQRKEARGNNCGKPNQKGAIMDPVHWEQKTFCD